MSQFLIHFILLLIKQTCHQILKRLAIMDYKNKTVRTLSGGTKRKLSVALALLGEPDVLLLVFRFSYFK